MPFNPSRPKRHEHAPNSLKYRSYFLYIGCAAVAFVGASGAAGGAAAGGGAAAASLAGAGTNLYIMISLAFQLKLRTRTTYAAISNPIFPAVPPTTFVPSTLAVVA
jgi:hypothetical protein